MTGWSARIMFRWEWVPFFAKYLYERSPGAVMLVNQLSQTCPRGEWRDIDSPGSKART